MASEGTGATGNTSKTTVTIDHHHPLYWQPCDILSNNIISFTLTGLKNYMIKSRSLKIGLVVKSKLGFVDERHTKYKSDASLHELWENILQ